MNYKERRILGLLYKILSVRSVENPCDIKGLAKYHKDTNERIDVVRNTLSEITCIDIPKDALNDIILELREALEGMNK